MPRALADAGLRDLLEITVDNPPMGHCIAVMNTKGGVGKSTIVMALAETLSAYHGKNVLVVDSDSQTSMSSMLMAMSRWEQLEQQHRTIVDYLSRTVLGGETVDWREFVASGVSDVEDAPSVYLIPSHMELSLLEREVSGQHKEVELRGAVRGLLADARKMFDMVLIDCPPGLSVLTECWLREVDYFLPPTKPDYLGVRGLSILKRFREQNAGQGFAELLGVLVNLKDQRVASEEQWHAQLRADPGNRCFETTIPRRAYIQRAADFDSSRRTYIAKYPGDAGLAVRMLAQEVLARLAGTVWQAPKPVVTAPRPARATPAAAAAQLKPAAAAPPASASAAAPPAPVPAAPVATAVAMASAEAAPTRAAASEPPAEAGPAAGIPILSAVMRAAKRPMMGERVALAPRPPTGGLGIGRPVQRRAPAAVEKPPVTPANDESKP